MTVDRPAEQAYGQGHAESVLRSQYRRTVDNSVAYLIPHLDVGSRVLDVGCGPGTITIDLARRVAPGEVVGIDISETVLQQARAAAADAGVDNVMFRRADIAAWDSCEAYIAGGFDIVHAHQVLMHLVDPVGALRQSSCASSSDASRRSGGCFAADAAARAAGWSRGRS